MLDLQSKKLQFIEEYLRLTDEEIIEKLSQLLKTERQKLMQAKLRPMTADELTQKLERSEKDIQEERLHTQEEVENYFKNKRLK
jgi:hypothetical protein